MATKKRGLGRGLDALLGSAASADRESGSAAHQGELRQLPVDVIRRGKYQPRTNMHAESLEELADSIRAQGVVQPIVVRPIGADQYEIIAGERRWRAAQLAGLHEVPAVIRKVPDQAAMAMALIENIQREDLNPMEEALALQRLISEFELTHQMVAEAVGRSRTAVTNLLRLFDLNEDVKALVEKGELEMGHARALLGLQGEQQSEVARQVVAKGLSVRETEQLVRRLQQGARKPAVARAAVDPDIRRLQEELAERLGASVRFQHSASGKGRLVIQYGSLEELEGILAHIK
ncbi:MAG: ParB/RepB/Spo0J family partition protein [Gammaproteobacteria bacterium]